MSKHPLDDIRELAAAYPEAEHTTILGDHEVYRVKEKVYLWLSELEDGGTYVQVKLKDSQQVALLLPFTALPGYGMGKWGWVEARFPKGEAQLPLIAQWIDESYRHTAPKKLLKLLPPLSP